MVNHPNRSKVENRDEYNGWTNRETWLVNLWLTNDSGTEQDVRAVATAEHSDGAAAQAIEGYVGDLHADLDMPATGMFYDLLTAAMARVNWREIAEHFREAA